MPTDDLKQHVNSKEDFYALLGIESTASEAEIRRAYRQTARKYHPDKVGASDTAAVEKFHQLQIAYDVLSDPTVKELYDNARRAREEANARRAAFDGRRKAMIDELEAQERAGSKRKRDEDNEAARQERELHELAEDGKRRRLAREEKLRREWEEAREVERKADQESERPVSTIVANEVDRQVAFVYKKEADTAHFTQQSLETLFSRFGPVEAVVLKEKRLKLPGEKHKSDCYKGIISFKSIVAAHAAVTDFPRLQASDAEFMLIESVDWASGQVPQSVPKAEAPVPTAAPPDRQSTDRDEIASQPAKPSKFSFNKHKYQVNSGQAGLDETLMMRLKEAEKRRLQTAQPSTSS